MVKRRIKQEIKKPDLIARGFAFTINWVKTNPKLCISGLAVALVIFISIFSYSLYSRKQDDKAQILLSQGIQSLGEYGASGNEESLKKAEDAFNKVAKEGPKKTKVIAELYLGKIYYLKGKTEDAKKLYTKVQNESGDPVMKMLSQRALAFITKKQ